MSATDVPEVTYSTTFKKEELELYDDIWQVWPAKPQRPFDKAACVERAVSARHYSWDNTPTNWCDRDKMASDWLKTDGILSPEEAAFWFSLTVVPGYLYADYNAAEVTSEWITQRCDLVSATATPDELFSLMDAHVVNASRWDSPEILARLLRALMPYDKLLTYMIDTFGLHDIPRWINFMGPPPASQREIAIEATAKAIEDHGVDSLVGVWNFYDVVKALPCQPMIEAILDHAVDSKSSTTLQMMRLLFSLRDKERVFELLKKLKYRKNIYPDREDIIRFYNYFGFEHLDVLMKNIMKPFRSKLSIDTFASLFEIKAPEIIESLPYFYEIQQLQARIEEEIDTAEPHILDGLLRAAGARNKGKKWALSMMRRLITADPEVANTLKALAEARHTETVQSLIDAEFFGDASSVDVHAKLDFLTTAEFSEQERAFAELTWPSKTPPWFEVEKLTPVQRAEDERALPPELIEGVAACMCDAFTSPAWANTRTDAIAAADEKIKAIFSTWSDHTTETYVNELLHQWEVNIVEDDAVWVFHLAGLHPCASVVDILDTYIRRGKDLTGHWQSQEALKKAIGSLFELDLPESYYALRGQAEALSDPNLKGYVSKKLEEYRKESKISNAEFDDLAVPTFDFEPDGTRTFDFGARQIVMTVRGRDDISFIDNTDPKKPRIFQKFPPSRKTDDPDKYAAARAQYKHIGENLRRSLREQNSRMLMAMVTGRKWRLKLWQRYIGSHPLLSHLARRLVWKVLDSKNNIVATVMVDGDGKFLDLDYEEFVMGKRKYQLGIVHPMELAEQVRQDWIDQLVDFEIIQPFEQINRTIYDEDAVTAYLNGFSDQLSNKKIYQALSAGFDMAGSHAWGGFQKIKFKSLVPRGTLEFGFSSWIYRDSWSWSPTNNLTTIKWKGKIVWRDGWIDADILAGMPEVLRSELVMSIEALLA